MRPTPARVPTAGARRGGVGRLAGALPQMAEIDVNPLVVTAQRSVALNVRIRIEALRSDVPGALRTGH
jgi:hypothetical protein